MLWFFMTLLSLGTPLLLIACGWWFIKRTPPFGSAFGYRSQLSAQNADAWQAAHTICGKLWLKCGAALLVLTAIVMGILFGKDPDAAGIACTVLMILQVGVMVATLPVTEQRLQKQFNPDGTRVE